MQLYKDRVPLSDVFHVNKQSTPDELVALRKCTLYSFYLDLATTANQKPENVTFVYISPEETESKRASDIMSKLQSEIKKARKTKMMYVGLLTKESTFHPAMMGFLKRALGVEPEEYGLHSLQAEGPLQLLI